MFMGKQFEEISKQFVSMNTPYWNIGKWRGSDPERMTDAEIDIVAADGANKDSDVLFCSCKYRSSAMDLNDLDELIGPPSSLRGSGSGVMPCSLCQVSQTD